jgi:DNA-binding NarL/FixJ family response regulator
VWPMRTLLVGDAGREELRPCVAQIRQRTQTINAARAADALSIAAGHRQPDLIVLAAGRPGEFALDLVEALRHAAPLARVVGLLGSWCEGETRTGNPWPAVPRIYWHEWAAWFERELAALAAGRCGTLSLPLTSTGEERLLHVGTNRHEQLTGVIGICTQERQMAETLAAGCQSFGYKTVRLDGLDRSGSEPLSAAIFDTSSPEPANCIALLALTSHWLEVPWIVTASFPRDEDAKRIQACGARAIVAKPFLLDDLHATINRLVLEREADLKRTSHDAAS